MPSRSPSSSTPAGPRRSRRSRPTSPRSANVLRAEIAAGRRYLPAGDHVLRAFRRPLADVRVLIVGQDPYPTPGASDRSVVRGRRARAPAAAEPANIYRELNDDLGIPPAPHGDLSAWSDQGVMLLNRVLTVQRRGLRHPTAARAGRR